MVLVVILRCDKLCGECSENGGSFEVKQLEVSNEVATIIKSIANTK